LNFELGLTTMADDSKSHDKSKKRKDKGKEKDKDKREKKVHQDLKNY